MGRKKGKYALTALFALMLAHEPAKAQSIEKQTYNTTLADGTHAQLTRRQIIEKAIHTHSTLYKNGVKIDPNKALQELNAEEEQQQQTSNKFQNFQNNQERQNNRADTSIERNSPITQEMAKLADTFVLLPFTQGQSPLEFNSYQELMNFMGSRNLNYVPDHIGLIKNGQKSRLSNTSFFQQHKNEIIIDYNSNYRHSQNNNPNQNQNIQPQNNPNGPQNNQENINNTQEGQKLINYNQVFNAFPVGRGEVLNYNEDGSATLFSYTKKYRTLTIKKLSNQSQILNSNRRNGVIDVNELFKNIPVGQDGKIIQDNGNGTGISYNVSRNKRGDEIKITLDKMIRVF